LMTKNMCSKIKIGIFGGSFDPVHMGHVAVATRAIEKLRLEKLYVIPAYIPPHKVSSTVAPYDLRRSWLKKVFCEVEQACVSDYERERGGISYSLFTVRHFAEVHGCKPFLVIGEDSLVTLESWYEYKALLNEATIVVYPRSEGSVDLPSVEKVVWLDAPRFDLSSTEIRKKIVEGKSIEGLVPDSILDEVTTYYG